MTTGAELVRKYERADDKGRVEIICKNYCNFMGIIECCTDGLTYQINAEHEYIRSKSKGELGVRVQTSSISDITSQTAISRTMIRKAIVKNDFSDGELDGLDNAYEYARKSYVLYMMRIDFELFNSMLKQLGRRDAELFRSYLLQELDYNDITEKYNIVYHSAIKKVRKIKLTVRKSFLELKRNDFMSAYESVVE